MSDTPSDNILSPEKIAAVIAANKVTRHSPEEVEAILAAAVSGDYHHYGDQVLSMWMPDSRQERVSAEDLAALDPRLPRLLKNLSQAPTAITRMECVRLTRQWWCAPFAYPLDDPYNEWSHLGKIHDVLRVNPENLKLQADIVYIVNNGFDYVGGINYKVQRDVPLTWLEQHFPGVAQRLKLAQDLGVARKDLVHYIETIPQVTPADAVALPDMLGQL